MRRLLGPLSDRVGVAHGDEPARAGRSGGRARRSSGCCSASSRNVCSASTTCSFPRRRRGRRRHDDDAVYYVGPNILGLEKRFAFRPLDFRRWIAIHEVTHRAQFTGVPWLRDYFLSLVHASRSAASTPTRADRRPRSARAADELRRGRNPLDEGGIVALLATPEHAGDSAKVQALMSLLEGHGNR